MSRKSQSALDRYRAKREGKPVGELAPRSGRKKSTSGKHGWQLLQLAILLPVLGLVFWKAIPREIPPIQLTYEIDLQAAPTGSLIITLIAEGDLPKALDLEFPPGVFGDTGNGVTPQSPAAHALDEAGASGQSLPVDRTEDGWSVKTNGTKRIGFIYRVDLARTQSTDQDIRRYISTPILGGLRAAGFEVFLEPVGLPVQDITVTIHNPAGLPVVVPWPALIRGRQQSDVPPEMKDIAQGQHTTQSAHLGHGQGYAPSATEFGTTDSESTLLSPVEAPPTATPLAANLFFHPENLADLNNALLICGDIRTDAVQARDCVIRYATEGQWKFPDDEVLNLIKRIARTEIGFFGSAPTPQITVLLAANEVTAQEGFDVYGVHTGSSVLVLVSRHTDWYTLEQQAASVIAHEMFHGWLGEAVPQMHADTLWFTEGATTWYSARMLTAAGIWTPQHAQSILVNRLENDYSRSPLLGRMTVADAAGQVMTEAGQVRFAYAGGVAGCAALDQWLHQATGRDRPLDQVLRYLYEHRDGQALTRQTLEAAVLAVTGVDCGPWLDTYIYGKTIVEPIDYLI